MRCAEGIVAISIPFTAGAAVAAALQFGGGETDIWMALACSVILVILFPLACRRGKRSSMILATYFILGLLCYFSSAYGISLRHEPKWAEHAMEAFCGLIDSVEFRHESTGPLVKALLTGRRDGLDSSIAESFRNSGASHILALSGLHLGVIYGILKKVLAILGNSHLSTVFRSTIIITACAFYMSFTGAAPSIVRAFLFITIGELSRLLTGRRHSNIGTFCAAITIQLCVNPQAITSISFQLSYLAMLGIILLFPTIDSWYPPASGLDLPRRIWSSMALSLSCQVFTAPLVWIRFHSFPKYFLLTNLIALPVTEALIVSAIITLSLSASGWCPEIAKSLTDFFGQTLISCLEIISSL